MERVLHHAEERATSDTFERFGGLCAIFAGAVIFLYSVAFIVIARSDPALGELLSAMFLLLSGLLISAALVAAYDRLKVTDPSFALWALLLGLVAALGSTIHGGYDLANAINPPVTPSLDLPSTVDPRGLLTFGVAGLATFVVAWLIGRGEQLPHGLGYLGYVLAILLVVIYVARLTVLSLTNPILMGSVLLAGFVVNPAWYIWLGLALWRGRSN